jgi:D-glycero-alpha-D-manno-heptose-7-phosphate kinase
VEFRTETDIAVHPVLLPQERLEDFRRHVVLVFTNIKRKAAEVVAKQLRRLGENTATLCAMRDMAHEGRRLLAGGAPLREFGDLLDEAWRAKHSLDSSISNPTIDAMYEAGKKAGAWGGKLLGAGGGGFMMFFASPDAHPRIRQAFADHHVPDIQVNAPGSKIIYG